MIPADSSRARHSPVVTVFQPLFGITVPPACGIAKLFADDPRLFGNLCIGGIVRSRAGMVVGLQQGQHRLLEF
jgi:hypothetical protein